MKKFPTDEASAANDKTFEPEEDLAAAQAQAGIDTSDQNGDVAMKGGEKAALMEKKGPTPAQLLALQAAIANAATLDEIQRLEAALTSGQMPSELDGREDMDVDS